MQVGSGQGIKLFSNSDYVCPKQMPLPGVIIFVHGVNSEGEWFTAAEEGLCRGLNRRLGRLDDQMTYKGVEGGQMSPVQYTESLTPDGYLNPDLLPNTYVKDDPSFSPVIHFRWGYKASKDELQMYGANVFLNEQNYWGGGPFANGCSSLADLWAKGLDDRVFGFLSVQGMNATDRLVYATPPRAYMVLAALRLANLIRSIREKQADVPITVVCHSQGNMVGMTAAFFGNKMASVTDPHNKTGKCVADTYVLASAPYSVVSSNLLENWSQRRNKDPHGERGRQTYNSRIQTLANFFQIIGRQADNELAPDAINPEMENDQPSPSKRGKPYKAESDRASHGLKTDGPYNKTYGRVTLYCCPHDQVISATPVQGIGWRGMSAKEIDAAKGQGIFTQRVFATNWMVGDESLKIYKYWDNDWRASIRKDEQDFFYPASSRAEYGLMRELRGDHSLPGMLGAGLAAPVVKIGLLTVDMRVNEPPPKGWEVPLEAPHLDEPFPPQTFKYGRPMKAIELKGPDGKKVTSQFNESYDPPSAARNAGKSAADKSDSDPYDSYKVDTSKLGNGEDAVATDAQGTEQSEAAQRYEDHAILRQEARREVQILQTAPADWVTADGKVVGEDNPAAASADYSAWHKSRISTILIGGQHNNPTNHSTTMTNPDHAEKALAYDVAIGVCHLSADDWWKLRIEADWRMCKGMDDNDPAKKYGQYFEDGVMKDVPNDKGVSGEASLYEWAHRIDEAKIPDGIEDRREGSLYLAAGALV
ncbi:hypothetical protein WL05_16615 [Burkholderia ubonensis]|nr:hypothetical protein WJ51_08800 [Burkholderia ubonensis]KVM18743.1 hypothetical protein WJ52_10750 [Burkholderia ubonensis]KVM48707.1 hypothetical protein WJ56_18960 [Burkholderia ubonensis]KVX47336.1 hypothetical protein WL05_16615 [Burkholderia ubonensis]KVX96344.1 hypothetical protein WL10_04505 [Burkholderia ubonensis]